MLTKEEFDILYFIINHPNATQRVASRNVGVSLNCTDDLFDSLRKKGYLNSDENTITVRGIESLKPYKVQNAIILAAGFASRCAPLSYEKPKGLFTIKGEVLIERQIRQLLDKGIENIYVVVGYKKELFYYLEEKFGVHIIVNEEYDIRNNLSSIYASKKYFGNSYICYSDIYLNVNGFEQYVYHSYFAAMYSHDYTDEYVIEFNPEGLINQYYIGASDCWYQMGEMYFDYETSDKFLSLLEREYHYPCVYDMKVDDFYIRHLSALNIYVKQCEENSFLEFDTIEEAKAFDNRFIQDMGENILTNICTVLACKDDEITNIQPIKRGLTNTVFSFECKGQKYIYRHPRDGSSKIIDREREAMAQRKAMELGLDPSPVAINPEKGWKICRFLDNIPFNYEDSGDIEKGASLIRKMHFGHSPLLLGWRFDMIKEAASIQSHVPECCFNAYEHFYDLRERVTSLYNRTLEDNIPLEMCHNDVCANNILIGKGQTFLIDWEYAGDNDPAADIASFIINYNFNDARVDDVLKMYFRRDLSLLEKAHYYAFISISAYFYFSWATYIESTGHNIREFSHLYFNYARNYCAKATELYEKSALCQ